MADVTPGSQTSEQATIQKVARWSRIVCGMVAAACTALLASGELAEGSQVYALLTMGVTVLTAIAGEFAQSIAYTKARTAVKVAASSSAALAEVAKSDPPKA